MHYYQTDIANRYPFDKSHDREVKLQDFTRFFGNPGILLGYYNQYLQNFVDTSTADWHWKKIDGKSLPFSEDTLRQIQQATRIHYSFFPKNDNQLFVQFTIQPYEFSDLIKTVQLTISDKHFVDDKDNFNSPHTITWPTTSTNKMTSVQLTMANENTIHTNFPGEWGWFKLLNQSYESMLTKKEILLNLSLNEHPAKYILAADGKHNPLGLNLSHFRLPQQLTDESA
jgi:type VI secretion system protein ImpL